jgi:hypothetical protein
MKKTSTTILFLFWAITILANGWHITTKYYSLPEGQSAEREEEIYLLSGYMKMVGGNLTTVFDLNKNEIIYINSENRTYWKGNPQRFLKEVRAELEASIEDKLANVPPDQRDEMRRIYSEMIDESFPIEGYPVPPKKNYSVRKEKDGEVISGYTATKYSVMEQGLPLESIWISPELPIAKEFDFVGLSHFLNQLAQGAYAASFESSQEYFKLIEKGYPVRVEIPRGDGSTQVSEVISAKRVNLKTSDFSVPAGFSPSTLTSVGVWDGYM